jgi:zinc protease
VFELQCKRQHVAEGLKLLGEILREPRFAKEEFERIKRAAIEDVRGRLKDPQSLAARTLARKLHPYAKDDVRYIATFEELIARYESTTLEQIRKLYETQLSGTKGELVVVGDFDHDQTVRQVESLLKDWKTSTPYRRIDVSTVSTVAASSEVIDTPDKANAVYRAGHLLAQRYTDPDYLALLVGNYILGEPKVSRLWDRIREKDGLSYGVSSSYDVGTLDVEGGFEFFAICNPANIAKVRNAMAEEIERFLKDGVTQDELDRAKKAILTDRRTFTNSEIVGKLASDLVSGDSFSAHAERSRKIGELTVEQVNTAMRKHLQPKKLVIVEAGDFSKTESPR